MTYPTDEMVEAYIAASIKLANDIERYKRSVFYQRGTGSDSLDISIICRLQGALSELYNKSLLVWRLADSCGSCLNEWEVDELGSALTRFRPLLEEPTHFRPMPTLPKEGER